MALQAGAILGQYCIRRQLGEGGMGLVYEARHVDIDRHVAIKVLHPKFASRPDVIKRFFNEARAVNRVEHPSVVPISEVNQLEDGTTYLVMEFLRGESLAARLKRLGGKLPYHEVVRLARQTASGLAAAHAKGIIHRDLKPDNVMLVPDSEIAGRMRVRILDFGIAKLLQPDRSASPQDPVTGNDGLVGTPRYMSPEQCRGGVGVDEKADVYALGVMLFEALAGRLPFTAKAVTEIIAMHIFEPPPSLGGLAPDAPEMLVSLIMRMLSKKPEDRPMMAQIATALAEPEISPDHSMSSISLNGFVLPDFMRTSQMELGRSAESSQHPPAPKLYDELPMSSSGAAVRRKRSSDSTPILQAVKDSRVGPPDAPPNQRMSSGGISTLGGAAGQYPRLAATLRQNRIHLALLGVIAVLLFSLIYVSLHREAPKSATPALESAPPSSTAPALPPKSPQPSGDGTNKPAAISKEPLPDDKEVGAPPEKKHKHHHRHHGSSESPEQ